MSRGAPTAAPSTRRDLRFSVVEGLAFSVMVGIGEAYVPAFALASGLGVLSTGLVATLPMLAGAVVQLVSPWAVARLGSHRRWVVGCAALQAGALATLVPLALTERVGNASLFAVMTVYWGAGLGTGPAWNTWIGTLVPRRLRARYFARRARWLHVATLAGLATGGAVLHGLGERLGPSVFALLFGTAAAARGVSAYFLSRHGEGRLSRTSAAPSRRALSEAAPASWGPGALRILAFLLALQVAVQVSAPYFTPYMLERLQLSYGAYAMLSAVSFAARIVALPAFGQLAHRRGSRGVLVLGAIGVVPLPLLWLVSDELAYLIALQCLAGVSWGAMELATTLTFFERIPEHRRTAVLTVFNLGHALAISAGVSLGGVLLARGAGASYETIFWVSALGRMVAGLGIVALPNVVLESLWVPLRTLAVRPGGGAVDRPVVPALVEAPQPPSTEKVMPAERSRPSSTSPMA